MKHIRLLDIVIILILLALSLALFASEKSEGSFVRIESEAGSWLYELSATATVAVPGPLGETVVRIENSSATILSSPCPGQTCAGDHIYSAPQTLVCLPNRVIVTISGESGGVDVTAY